MDEYGRRTHRRARHPDSVRFEVLVSRESLGVPVTAKLELLQHCARRQRGSTWFNGATFNGIAGHVRRGRGHLKLMRYYRESLGERGGPAGPAGRERTRGDAGRRGKAGN